MIFNKHHDIFKVHKNTFTNVIIE